MKTTPIFTLYQSIVKNGSIFKYCGFAVAACFSPATTLIFVGEKHQQRHLTSHTKFICGLVLLLLCSLTGLAQNLQVEAVFPKRQTITAAANTEIAIAFNTPIDISTITDTTFRAFGRWSGPMSGTFTLDNDNTRLRFQPTESFFAGEWVTVNLAKAIQNMQGDSLVSYTWNFWIETSPGSLDQRLVDIISLRRPAEGLIQTYGAYAGDLNNDGFSDLTVVNEKADDLRIFLNDGLGNYSGYERVPMGDKFPSPNEGGDFDLDGQIDLAVSTAHQDEVRVLFGDGTGTFPTMETYTTGNGARGVVVFDCDGNGTDDILTTNRLESNLTLLTNQGDGSFSTQNLIIEGQGQTACAVTDINNDGIIDVFVGMHNSQEIGVLLGDGNGGFTMTATKNVVGRPWMIAAGDVNGDGHADVVSANSTGNSAVVLLGDGTGNLQVAETYLSPDMIFPLAIDLGDLDGDGDLDMVTSNYSSANYTIFENDGTGNFELAKILDAPNKASCAILHDRDNDGDLDITTTDEGNDVILIFENVLPTSTHASSEKQTLATKAFPNPAKAEVTIEYDLPIATKVQLEIQDASGKTIQQFSLGKQAAGSHQFTWNRAEVATGLYFYKISTSIGKASGSVLLLAKD